MKVIALFLLLAVPAMGAPPVLKETPHFLYYRPAGPVGLALCFHPGGDAQAAAAQLLPFADRYHLMVAGSKEFRNGPNDLTAIAEHLRAELLVPHAPDPRRSFCTGLSGGGQFSYSFVSYWPDQFSGVVVNTCRFNPQQKTEIIQARAHLPRGKWAVMLASPSDFRYAEMNDDRAFLTKQGWKVTWLEFTGGHTYAPAQLMDTALRTLQP